VDLVVVVLKQFLHLAKGLCVLLDASPSITFPQLDLFGAIDGQNVSLVVHDVVVDKPR